MPEPPLPSARPTALSTALRRRVASLEVPPEHEAAVLDELLLHSAELAEAQGIDTHDDDAVEAWLEGSGAEPWAELSRELARSARARSKARARRLGAGGASSFGVAGDLRQAVRSLRAAPGFTIVAVGILALGIGLVSSAFSLIDHLLLKPLPVADEDRLLRLFSHAEDSFFDHGPLSPLELTDLDAGSDALGGVAGFSMTFTAIENAQSTELVLANMVTGGYFELLGVKPALGRLLGPGDDDRGSPQSVLVLSHEAWSQRFGADPEIVGRELRVNGQPLVVVGVTAKGFRGLLRGFEPVAYLPVATALRIGAEPATNSGAFDPALDLRDQRSRRWLWGLARRTERATAGEALNEIDSVARAIATAYPESEGEHKIVALPLRDVTFVPGADSGIRTVSWLLFAVAALVLLIACANLANLLLARAVRRRHEVATRLSLGAGRWQIARMLLVESLLLAFLGGSAGLALTALSNAALNGVSLPIVVPIELHLQLDWRVAAFTIGIAALTALGFGLAPVLEAWRTDLATVLRRESTRGGSARRRRLQAALVVAQVTLSLLLLVAAGLTLRSVLAAQRIDPGFDTEGTVAATLMLELQGYDDGRTAAFYRRLRDQLSGLPGVEQISLPSHLPLTLWSDTWQLVPQERQHLPLDEWAEVDIARIDPSYFETLRITLRAGTSFSPEEMAGDRRLVVVNETLAGRFWPGEEAVGRLVSVGAGEQPYRVVGVARDGRYRTLGEDQRAFAYVPISESWTSRAVVVRFEREDVASTAAVAAAIHAVDPHLAISNLATLDEVISPSLVLPRAGALVFGALGAIGLLLAAVGLYGLLAYAVGQRTHEIGLRVALGASRADVLGMVVRDGLRLALLGSALGLAAAFATTRALRSLLYGVSPTDARTFAGVVLLFLVVALFASVMPARRALRIDPMRALRHD